MQLFPHAMRVGEGSSGSISEPTGTSFSLRGYGHNKLGFVDLLTVAHGIADDDAPSVIRIGYVDGLAVAVREDVPNLKAHATRHRFDERNESDHVYGEAEGCAGSENGDDDGATSHVASAYLHILGIVQAQTTAVVRHPWAKQHTSSLTITS